jgi:hypothetical protein
MDIPLIDLDPFHQRPDDLAPRRPRGRFQTLAHPIRIPLETLKDRPQALHASDPLRDRRRFRIQLG